MTAVIPESKAVGIMLQHRFKCDKITVSYTHLDVYKRQEMERFLYGVARSYSECFRVYGEKSSFEWQQLESEMPVLYSRTGALERSSTYDFDGDKMCIRDRSTSTASDNLNKSCFEFFRMIRRFYF